MADPRPGAAHPAGSVLARNSVWNLLGYGLPMLVALAVIPVLTRELGPARFGVLALAGVVVALVAEVGFWRAVAKFGAEAVAEGDAARLAGVVRTTAAAQLILGLAGGAALWLAADWVALQVVSEPRHLAETAGVARVLALMLPLVTLGAGFRAALESAQRFGLVNLVRVPVNMGTFLLPLAGILAGWDLVGILWLLLASRAVAMALFLALAVRLIAGLAPPDHAADDPAGAGAPGGAGAGVGGRTASGEDRARTGRILAYGGWTIASSAVSVVLGYLDRFLLAGLVSAAALGYYTPPLELTTRLLIIPAAAVATLLPAFSALVVAGSPDEWSRRFSQALKVVALAIGPILMLLAAFAPEVLGVWVGAGFATVGALPLRILALGVFFSALAHILVSLLQGVGRPDLVARVHVVELAIYAPVLWWLIAGWGVVGAAVAWTVRAALDLALLGGVAVAAGQLRVATVRAQRVPATVARLLLLGLATVAAAQLPAELAWRAALASVVLGAGWWLTWRQALTVSERWAVLRTVRLAPGVASNAERG
jgi:O-antigen/teichoic acid export membrane protein